MRRLSVSVVIVAAALAVMAPAPASAVTFDKLTYLTFSGPVQVPGVTLNAGTYRFRLTNPDTSRNVLQVLSNDGAIVYAMFHTIPDGRAAITEDPFVTFKETPIGVPPAVKSLFYGGEYHGYEFVYGKGEPNMIAPVWPQPEITYTAFPAAIPEPVIEPAFEPVAEPVAEPAPVEEVAPVAEPAAETPAVELPQTATRLPLVGAGGLASLLVGLGLVLLRRRVN